MMRYLEMFAGIGAFSQAVKELGLDWECVGFSEIDKYAIQIYQKHFPDHINLGDITKINPCHLPEFDFIVGGSPCQDLSIAKNNRQGLDGARSGLFWDFLSIIKLCNPKYFLLENVNSMQKEAKALITKEMGVQPVMVDAALVSAQSRKRLFWCNWNVSQPSDRGILLKDILESGDPQNSITKSYCIDANYFKGGKKETHNQFGKRLMVIDKPIRIGDIGGEGQGAKTGLYMIDTPVGAALRSRKGEQKLEIGGEKSIAIHSNMDKSLVFNKHVIRKLTPVECERLQCFPDGYTEGISNTQRYKCLGNAFNVEVIKHIISELII
jgi:DNA (cytosine-5)-methyltransferase 3A